jgi:hypothetical protein
MKSITIHKLEPDLAEQLEKRAKREGRSLNQTVKGLLRSALGLRKPDPIDHRDDFADLFGSWTPDEASAFDARVQEKRPIDASDWER